MACFDVQLWLRSQNLSLRAYIDLTRGVDSLVKRISRVNRGVYNFVTIG